MIQQEKSSFSFGEMFEIKVVKFAKSKGKLKDTFAKLLLFTSGQEAKIHWFCQKGVSDTRMYLN